MLPAAAAAPAGLASGAAFGSSAAQQQLLLVSPWPVPRLCWKEKASGSEHGSPWHGDVLLRWRSVGIDRQINQCLRVSRIILRHDFVHAGIG